MSGIWIPTDARGALEGMDIPESLEVLRPTPAMFKFDDKLLEQGAVDYVVRSRFWSYHCADVLVRAARFYELPPPRTFYGYVNSAIVRPVMVFESSSVSVSWGNMKLANILIALDIFGGSRKSLDRSVLRREYESGGTFT